MRRSVIMEGAVVRGRARLEDAVVEPEAEVVGERPSDLRTFSRGVHFPFSRRERAGTIKAA